MSENLAARLEQSVAALGLAVDAAAQQRMLDYLALLQKWNGIHNLTAVREPEKMLSHHLSDCLAVLPHLAARTLVDVGSGAGLPGIPLALARPDWHVTLLECNHKKAAFLRQTLIEIKIDNAAVVAERVETWRPQEKFDMVISRAFSDLREYVLLAGHLCAPGGAIAAMKGLYPYEELAQIPEAFELEKIVALNVPDLRAKRHLVLLRAAV